MSDRLEVLPGAGTVLRHGSIAVWIGPAASPALLSFLVQSADNVGASAHGGLQIVDHIAGILSSRDPEPGAPFGVIGPSGTTWITLLHGPVQLWDGTRWLAPTPQPGWLRAEVQPQPAVSIGASGGSSPRLVADSPYDLRAGTVPGGGMILVPGAGRPTRAERSPVGAGPTPAPTPLPSAATGPRPVTDPGTVIDFGTVVDAGPAIDSGPAIDPGPAVDPGTVIDFGTVVDAGPAIDVGTATAAGVPAPGSSAPPVGPFAARHWSALRDGTAAGPPLPTGGRVTPADRPQVTGVRCIRGHFNHPAARTCAWCGRAVTPGQPQTFGPRPVLGALIADDGATWRLDADQVLGSDPTTDQGVATGRIRGVVLASAGQLAPSHAEIRLSDWAVTLLDRGSAGGTFVVQPGATGWTRLTPYQPVVVPAGSHLSLGQRVLTFVSPWP
jgi:hypothetical protein